MHVPSHVDTCLIHHLCWAAVAVAWLMTVRDPLILVPEQESNHLNHVMTANSDSKSEQEESNMIDEFTKSVIPVRSYHGCLEHATRTQVNTFNSSEHRLSIEETLEFINQMERVPLSAADKQDLTEILNLW